jgi:hypothetical protein
LPEGKPRYVMGVVCFSLPTVSLSSSHTDSTHEGISRRPHCFDSTRCRHVRLRMADPHSCNTYPSSLFSKQQLTQFQRFGNAIVPSGTLNIRNATYANDFSPIDENCTCVICRPKSSPSSSSSSSPGLGITRAYLYHIASKETVGAHLLTMHNIHYMLNLMKEAREAILGDRYPEFIRAFFAKRFPEGAPMWVRDALEGVGVVL